MIKTMKERFVLNAAVFAAVFSVSLGFTPVGVPEARAQSKSCYRTFYTSGVELQVCNNTFGASGAYIVRNTSNADRHVCWTLVYRDGSQNEGCKANLRARSEATSGCYNCNTQHKGGVVEVIWRRNDVK